MYESGSIFPGNKFIPSHPLAVNSQTMHRQSSDQANNQVCGEDPPGENCSPPARDWDRQRLLLLSECLLLFFLLPVSLYWVRSAMTFRIIPLILLTGLFSWLYLRKVAKVSSDQLWRVDGVGRALPKILLFFVPAAALLALFAWQWLPEQFLHLPRQRPVLWAAVMVLYPLLAAAPQELFFRAYFFHRYRGLFPDQRLLIAVNAASFGLAHLFFGNWLAPVLSTCGGLLFASRYQRTSSLMAITIEHGLWGNFLFTIGYGLYFYSGAIR